MPKGKDLPESVKWLRDFVNLGCKPGVLSLKRLHEETKIEKPPAEPAILKTLLIDYNSEAKSLNSMEEKLFLKELAIKCKGNKTEYIEKRLEHELRNMIIEEYKGIYSRYFLDVNGNEWAETVAGEPIYRGNKNDFPLEEEIKDFLRETGIELPQNQTARSRSGEVIQFIQRGASEEIINTKFWDINKVWLCAKYSLSTKLEGEAIYPIPEAYSKCFVHNCYDSGQIGQPEVEVTNNYGVKYNHDNTFIQKTCACVLDFWQNHRELHECLWQCRCCGKFWIDLEQKQRGRPREFCIGERCKNVFYRWPREKDRKAKKEERERIRKKAKPKIIKYIMENRFEKVYDNKKGIYVFRLVSKERAKEIYEEVKQRSPNNVSSLAEFIRTEGRNM